MTTLTTLFLLLLVIFTVHSGATTVENDDADTCVDDSCLEDDLYDEEVCEDKVNCHRLGLHMCQTNQEMMLDKCRKFCKFCDVDFPCEDVREECPEWASQGECDNNPGYMKRFCPHSCETCRLKNCLREPGVPQSFKPYELYDMLRGLPEAVPEYEPSLINEDPPIVMFDALLSEHEVDGLLASATNWKPSAELSNQAERQHLTAHRTSETSFCTGDCDTSAPVKNLSERVSDIVKVPFENFEYLQFVRYGPGQYYKVHHDSNEAYTRMPMGHRVLTLFIYLSDMEEGGETRFPTLDKEVEPKKGRAILWPNVIDRDPNSLDRRTLHEAKPVIKGFKNACNFWIYQYDYRNPWQFGCTG